MFYKWVKYLAAHAILAELAKHDVVIKGSEKDPMYSSSYSWVNLQTIKSGWYSITTLRDAALMLYHEKEIDILNNIKHEFNIQLKIFANSGIIALKEKKYVWKAVIGMGKLIGGIIGGVTAIILLIKELH